MKKKPCVSTLILCRMIAAASVVALGACADGRRGDVDYLNASTPTVDYVETLDVYSAPHKDSFLNQLAMNYRSYAIYNARTSGYPDMGELFAQKAVAAFSGELPFPESLNNWPVQDAQMSYELTDAYNELMEQLKDDATYDQPQLAAEAQAKFDCWLSAAASGQTATAKECRSRFIKTMDALRECRADGKAVKRVAKPKQNAAAPVRNAATYYPETRNMSGMQGGVRAREGVIIVNNVNVPEHLINPVPVQPLVFNQNIYGADKSITNSNNNNTVTGALECVDGAAECGMDAVAVTGVDAVKDGVMVKDTVMVESVVAKDGAKAANDIPMIGEELVTRAEFINMMMAMRAELAAINNRLDQIQANGGIGEKTMIKVQQIPLEPTQHVMEEVLEIRFDFDKATIKPEYDALIRKLAGAAQENKNIKVSVVGHTDTMGSKNYNYALGGRRAEAVQKMLIQYGIPASQIVAVSAGEEDLKVPTPDGVANAENRRVRVVKEIHYDEKNTAPAPVAIEIEEYSDESCGMYGCMQ